MSKTSSRKLNVNLLGFKVPLASDACLPSVPSWLTNNSIVESLAYAYIDEDDVDIE